MVNTGGNKFSYSMLTYTSTGNGADFGDLSIQNIQQPVTNNTRSVFCGRIRSGQIKCRRFVEAATLGNATDFGD